MAGGGQVQRSKLKVGVLIFVALSVVAAVALLTSGNAGLLFAGKLEVRAYFPNSIGLKIGAPVKLDGVTIGNVRSIRIVDHPAKTPVEVVMAIGSKYRSDVLTDSRANLNTIGVLGSMEVDIDNVHAHGQPVENKAVIQTGGIPNLQNAMQSFQRTNQKISTTLGEANVLVKHLSSNKGSIGKLINDPTLRNRAAATIKELSSISTQVNSGKGTVGKILTDDSLTKHVKDTGAKVSTIGNEVKSGQGTAGKFVKDPALSKNLKSASAELHQISSEARSGHGAVAMMLHNPDFRQKLHDTRNQLQSIEAQTGAGMGTIGQMKKNPSLDNHLKELVGNSRKLVTGLRKHPMKYVKIRFRIF